MELLNLTARTAVAAGPLHGLLGLFCLCSCFCCARSPATSSSSLLFPSSSSHFIMSAEDVNVSGSLDGEENGTSVAIVQLTSKDNREFAIEKKFAICSNLIKASLEQGWSKKEAKNRNRSDATDSKIARHKFASLLTHLVVYLSRHVSVQTPLPRSCPYRV
jgi:hypothetical protein